MFPRGKAIQVKKLSIQILYVVHDLAEDLPPAIFFAQDHVPGNAVITETRATNFARGERESYHCLVFGLLSDFDP